MTKVTVKCSAIKGTLSIYGSPSNTSLFLCEGASYRPMELTADTLGEAVDKLMQNLHQLRYTPEVEARNKERSRRMSEHHQNKHASAGRQRKAKPAQEKTVTSELDGHN